MFNKNIIKVYNGTNHKVAIYNLDNENFITSRSNMSNILTNMSVLPYIEYPQKITLDVKKIAYNNFSIENIRFSFPDSIEIPLPFEGYNDYDVILVSRLFAETVKNDARYCQIYPDFVDRLYVVGTKVKNEDNKLIGNSGIQKANLPQIADYYISQYSSGRKPSLVSAQMALYWLQVCGMSNSNNYCLLNNYIYCDMMSRRKSQQIIPQTLNV